MNVPVFDIVALRPEEEKVSGLKLFHTTNGGVTEAMPRLAKVEADVQDLIEAHMDTMLGAWFLASEYVPDCVDGGWINSLGLDENGAPLIVKCKRGTDIGVTNQGLYFMSGSWHTRTPSGTWSANGSGSRPHPRSCGAHLG